MKQPVAFFFSLAVLTALTSCRAKPPAPPSIQTVNCEVTVQTGDAEYLLNVKKESDELASYRFCIPEEADGLTYEFIGSELPAVPALCGVADVLHAVLTLGADAYCYEDGHFVAVGEQGQIQLTVLPDGNVSQIEMQDAGIRYYFNYAP